MYGTKEDVSLRSDVIPFKAGITNNVKVSSVKFENAKKDGSSDQNIIVIQLTNSEGGIFVHKEWDTKGDEGKTKSQMVRLKRFVKETTGEDFPTNFSSWEDCAEKFIAAMSKESGLIQVKLLYNTKGYLELVRYDSGIRSMSNPTLLLSDKESQQCVKPNTQASSIEDETTSVPSDPDF